MVTNTSKTYEFNPSLGELVLYAYSKVQIRPTEITQQHMYTARIAANMMLSELSNIQPNLWEVGLQTTPLVQGVATYAVPAETVMILDAYITYGTPSVDRFIFPISRTEYAAIPNKAAQGVPSQFWFDRLISPTITFYLTPDGGGPFVCNYYSVRQTQDAILSNGQTVEIPYRWLSCYGEGLAWKLSETYAPQLETRLQQRYLRSLNLAMTQDTENVPLNITPSVGGYWTR